MSRDLVRACAIGRAATLRRGPGPAGVRADGLFSPAGWDTPTWAQATCGGRVPTCRANACGGRPAATSVSRPASAHGLRKSGEVSLAAVDLLAGVVAARATADGVGRAHRLRVDDRRTGLGPAPEADPQPVTQRVMDASPGSAAQPAGEGAPDRGARWELPGQFPPADSAPDQIED